MDKLYTWGYTGSKPEDIKAYCDALNALLVDIRYSPRSRNPQWSVAYLKGAVPYHYMGHLLGNPNYNNDGPIKLAAPEKAIGAVKKWLAQPKRTFAALILVCACKDWRECHRRVAALALGEAFDLEVEHLPSRFADWAGLPHDG